MPMVTDTTTSVSEPRPGMVLDPAELFSYLRSSVQGFPAGATGVRVRQFGNGQSNPTYLVEATAAGAGGPLERFVLRKKPPARRVHPSALHKKRIRLIYHFGHFFEFA